MQKGFSFLLYARYTVNRIMTGAATALAVIIFTADSSQTVSARTPQVVCVRAPGDRICRLHATAAQQRRYAPPVRIVKRDKPRRVAACPPGTRPDGKWYLVSGQTLHAEVSVNRIRITPN